MSTLPASASNFNRATESEGYLVGTGVCRNDENSTVAPLGSNTVDR